MKEYNISFIFPKYRLIKAIIIMYTEQSKVYSKIHSIALCDIPLNSKRKRKS